MPPKIGDSLETGNSSCSKLGFRCRNVCGKFSFLLSDMGPLVALDNQASAERGAIFDVEVL